jgi:hypothetical protein
MVGEALLERPCVVDFRDVELIEWRFAVYTSTRIAVPKPDAARTRSWKKV